MSLVYVDPRVPEQWGSYYVKHVMVKLAWVNMSVVGISYRGGKHDANTEVVQNFLNAQGWNGLATWRYPTHVGANGMIEYCGGMSIIWEWGQILSWLRDGWPTTRKYPDMGSPIGTLCYADGIDPMADHIDRTPIFGWDHAMKQMRTIGIPFEVRKLERLLTEEEAIDALCGALKRHRLKLNHLTR